MQNCKKRFTDTLKWEKEWFLSLEVGDKLVWLYLLDSCNEAGLWNVNWRLCSMLTGVELTEPSEEIAKQLIKTNHDKVYYLKGFMEFQYPDYMLKKSPMIRKCVDKLIRYGVVDADEYKTAQNEDVMESVSRVVSRVQEEEKEIDKEEDKVKVVKKKKDVSLKSITEELLEELQLKNLDIDVKDQFDRFKDHLSAHGKRYKDHQAAFRNWLKSPYVEKTDKIRVKMRDEQIKKEALEERERLRKLKENGEDFGPPKEFQEQVKKMLGKMSVSNK